MVDLVSSNESWGDTRAKLNAAIEQANGALPASDYTAEDVAEKVILKQNSILGAVKTITASAYTVIEDDVNSLIVVNNTGGCTITLPNNLAAPAAVQFLQRGTGIVTFAVASGATMPQGSPASSYQFQFIGAVVDANSDGAHAEWIFSGV